MTRGEWSHNGVKSRDTMRRLAAVLLPGSVSMNPGLPQVLPLDCYLINLVFNLEQIYAGLFPGDYTLLTRISM